MSTRNSPGGDGTVVCPTCERTGPADRHPCRFEAACACWYGVACEPKGATMRQMEKGATR